MRKIDLILEPTPLHPLPRMSEDLGIDLWIKRDDLTGFALGGNKGRKLQFLMAEALDGRATTVVSCGALQSNFLRQLGAACAVLGLECVAVAMAMPYEDRRPASPGLAARNGNVRLDEILGVDLRVVPDGEWEELYAAADRIADELEAAGKRVYRIPVGGSSPLGAYAFYEAGREVAGQAEPFDCIVFPSSSGSTQVGLAYAFRDTPTRVLGICCDPEPEIVHDFARLGEGLAEMLGVEPLSASDFRVDFDFVGEGYGIPSPQGQEAIQTLARREGIFLDPVYTGKAFAGLIALSSQGVLGGRVLFWHTGGVPALFALQ